MAAYYVWSGAAGTGSGANWTNAKTTLTLAFVTEVAGDTLYVAHDHAETTASAITLTSSGTSANPTKIVCVNRAGSVPPVSADRRTTASVTSTNASTSMTFDGHAHYDGIVFHSGSSTGSAAFALNTSQGQWNRFDNCQFQFHTTGSTARVFIGASLNPGAYIEWNNTTISFANSAQYIAVCGILKWRNTPSALPGTVPVKVFMPFAGGGEVECIGVDLSAGGSSKTIVDAAGGTTVSAQKYRFIDCKLAAGDTLSSVPTNLSTVEADFVRSGNSGVNYTVYRNRRSGVLTEETTIVRTGGALA